MIWQCRRHVYITLWDTATNSKGYQNGKKSTGTGTAQPYAGPSTLTLVTVAMKHRWNKRSGSEGWFSQSSFPLTKCLRSPWGPAGATGWLWSWGPETWALKTWGLGSWGLETGAMGTVWLKEEDTVKHSFFGQFSKETPRQWKKLETMRRKMWVKKIIIIVLNSFFKSCYFWYFSWRRIILDLSWMNIEYNRRKII